MARGPEHRFGGRANSGWNAWQGGHSITSELHSLCRGHVQHTRADILHFVSEWQDFSHGLRFDQRLHDTAFVIFLPGHLWPNDLRVSVGTIMCIPNDFVRT